MDDIFKKLQGKWKADNFFDELTIKGDTLILNGKKVKTHVLKSSSDDNYYKIVDQDSSRYELFDFFLLEYNGENLIGRVMVCDAEPIVVKFAKVK